MYLKNQYAKRILFAVVICSVLLGMQNRLNAQNAIVTENALTGNLPSEWDVSGVGDPSIQGFPTDISVNRGSTISFKINTDATAYHIDIYRLGYYGGRGARKVATINPSVSLPQTQPNFLRDSSTGLVDCGNWAVSASWAVPSTAVSGVYIARPVRTDTGGASHMIFVVRDDASTSDLHFQTSDPTWVAYNKFGGANFYGGNGPAPGGRCYKASYNRPYDNRSQVMTGAQEGFLWDSEYPLIRWLEANGYNVDYASGIDTDRRGVSALTRHKVFLSVGHDEYWSKVQRANVEAARAAAMHLCFFSGNFMYWKTRWENSIAGTSTAYRTLACYKETWSNAKVDPSAEWTGTWRDARFSPPADGGNPENSLSGTLFTANAFRHDPMLVTADQGKLRFWRNTGLDTLAPGQIALFPAGVLGYEWDEVIDNGFLPPGLIEMSSTTIGVDSYCQDPYGLNFAPGVGTHHLTLYRHSSGALVFSAATTQWSWGLDATHDLAGTPVDNRMKQATVNVFADMGVQPATLQSGLVAATQSSDVTPPTSTITPVPGGTVLVGAPAKISGTATDFGGGKVGGVEFSLDNGATWHPADGTNVWTATWSPSTPGAVTIKSRATDDSGRIETPGPGTTVTVIDNSTGSTLFPPDATPMIFDQNDGVPEELGMRFQADRNGFIRAIRFYKCAANTGLHTGHIWDNNGNSLASVTFTNETPFGWQEAQLANPLPITAGTTYIVSYHHDSGHFSLDPSFFLYRSYYNPPLIAPIDGLVGYNGANTVGASAFPGGTWMSTNYWVDVVFTAGNTTDTTPPSVTSVSPANGSSNVSTATSVTAQFSEEMAPWTIGSPNLSYPSGLTFSPSLDSAHDTMLRSFKMGKDLQFSITQVPNGTYDVYIWTFEDSKPLTATISVEGSVVSTYTSGLAGSWKRLGPFTKTISDGDIQVRMQSNDLAIVSGLEIWSSGGSTPPAPPVTETFYRGINLGGPSLTVDGNSWDANTTVSPNFTFNYFIQELPGGNPGGLFANFPFNPPIDTPEHQALFQSYRWNTDIQLSLTNVPSGTYNVYLWTLEANYALDTTLAIEQNTALPVYNTGGVGHWAKLGPFPVDINDGNIQLRYKCLVPTDATLLSGLEVWQTTSAIPTPAGTFYRAINVAGSALTIDGHSWEAETTSNYTTNIDSNPFSLRNGQGTIVPATITYNSGTHTATLRPNTSLSATSNYTATIKGGPTGVTDVAGNRLPSDVTWSFNTGTSQQQQAATPTFSPPAGTYSSAQSVTISDTSSGTQIYYTTDGSTPTTSSTLYTGPVLVNTTTTIKAIAAGAGWTTSAVGSATYTIQISSAPAAPSSLSANPFSATQVNLSWTDNSSNETAFLLERKTGSGGTYAQIASIAANTTSYSDNTVSASTTYFYRIRATNANGNSSYSNEATATTQGATAVPSPWSDADIGSVGQAGSATYLNGTFTVKGSGADIWNTADAFHFVYQPWTGDGEIIVQVESVQNTDVWAKSGVMIRETLNANSKHAMMVVTPGSGVSFQRRTSTGGSSVDTTTTGRTAPEFLRLTRVGSTFTAYYSSTGTSWTQIGSATISMASTVQFGLPVTAHNNSALCTAVIDTVSVGTSLGAPTGLTATAISDSQINLSWIDHATAETGFKIERKTGSGGTYAQIATLGANVTSYSDTGLSPGTTYFYRVRANNSTSNSSYSNEASATTQSNPPGAPTNLGANATSSSQINLAWTDNANNETGFKIERKTGTGGTYSQIATVGANVTTYSNTGLSANTNYFYRVRANNSSGDSAYSNEANATTPDVTPTAPSNLAANAISTTQINLTWSDNASNETGFKIERKTGSGGTYAQIATVGANVASYGDSGLTSGTTYYYRVRANNAVGDSGYSNEANATTLSNPPGAPTALGANAASSSQINLAWTDNANNETGFKIERKTGLGGTYAQIATVGANIVTFSDNSVSPNTTYYYRVRATNSGGDSSYSNEANATTPDAPPAAPNNLAATAVSTTQINLSWTDNASNETGFKIERKTGSGGTYAQIGTVGANVTTYSDSGLTASTTYYYRVRANNAIGDSGYSNEANATTSATIPTAPSALTATAASSTQINLGWTDNASNEIGFKIERKTGSGGTYSQIATVGAGVVTYNDTGLTASTTYYYRVRATNGAGDSGYSNEANATTNAAPTGGLEGDYFDNMDFTGYVLSRLDSTVDFNWGSGSPDPSVGVDTFSVRWTGQVQPQYSQTYTFYTNSDDGVRLWVNGQLLIDNWTDHGPTENSGTIALTANQKYDIVMVYYENGGGAVAQLSWSSASQAKQIIPSNRLFPVPATPYGLTATAASGTQVDLSWTDVSANETSFKIERKTGSGGSYSQIATVGANVTSYSNTGLTSGTTYFYRMRASNSSGDSSYSNEVNATPTSAPSFRAATSNETSSSSSLTIGKPAGTQSGDVMVTAIAIRPNTASITASGWTLVRRINNTNSNPNSLAVYYKVAGSSEPSSYTFSLGSHTGAVGGIRTFTNVNTSSPVDAEAGQNTSNGTTHSAPSVTTHLANDMIVTSHAFASSATFTPPSGMTEAFEIASEAIPSSGGECMEGNYQLQAAIGSTGSKTATASNDADVGNAHTLALKSK